MHIPRRPILAVEITLLGILIWVVGLRGSDKMTQQTLLLTAANHSVPSRELPDDDRFVGSAPQFRIGHEVAEAIPIIGDLPSEQTVHFVRKEGQERLRPDSAEPPRTTETVSPRAPPRQRLATAFTRPVSLVLSSWPMVDLLCLQQRYNCSSSHLHNRSLTVDFLTVGSNLPSTTLSGNDSLASHHHYTFRSTMETGQRMRFSIPWAQTVDLAAAAAASDNGAELMERKADPWCCGSNASGRAPTCYIVHLVVGHFHVNLMHSLFRVATLQRAVLELQESQAKHCPNAVPRHPMRANVRLLIIRRRPVAGDDVGFLAHLIPLVEDVDGVEWWPQRQLSSAFPLCVASAGYDNNNINSTSDTSVAPVRRCRPTQVTTHNVHEARASHVTSWNCSTSASLTSSSETTPAPRSHRDLRRLATLSCAANVRMHYDFIPFYQSPLRPETIRVFQILRQSMERRWALDKATKEDATQPQSSGSMRANETGAIAGLQNHPAVTVLVVNRRRSRRILNVDVLVDGILRAQQQQGGLGAEDAAVRLVVKSVELEGLSMRQQAATMRHADVVIAVHGAALAWALAMAHGSSLLELVPAGWAFLRKDTSMFQPLSVAAELSEHIQFPLRSASGTTAGGAEAFSRNITIHRKDLRKIVAWVTWRVAEHGRFRTSLG